MFAKILALVFMSVFGFAVASGTNTAAAIALPIFVLAVVCLYFLPSIEAYQKNHENLASILVVNTLLGWSLIGWVFALVWAIKKPNSVIQAAVAQDHTNSDEFSICPYCSEIVKKSAIKCKHCRSDLTIPE